MMATSSRTCHCQSCTVGVPVALEKEGLCPDHYLEEAFGKLALATEQLRHGQIADCQTLDWLLAQAGFVLDSLAEESTTWDSDQRSKLLELLLGIANLNEYVRHSTI
jgi:hypothetical protein